MLLLLRDSAESLKNGAGVTVLCYLLMVVGLMKIVVFYGNTFIESKGVSTMLPLLSIIEGVILDCNLYFCAIYSKFLKTYEETKNNITPRIVNAIALEPNENLQGGICCISLASSRILNR